MKICTLCIILFSFFFVISQANAVEQSEDTPSLYVQPPRLVQPIDIPAPQQDCTELSRIILERADIQLNWLMWGMSLFAIVATLGTLCVSWQIYSKSQMIQKDKESCVEILKEIQSIKEHAKNANAYIQQQKELLISRIPEELSESNVIAAQNIVKHADVSHIFYAEAVLESKNNNHMLAYYLWKKYLSYDYKNQSALFNAAGQAYFCSLDTTDMECEEHFLKESIHYLSMIPEDSRDYLVYFNWGRHLSTLGKMAQGHAQHTLLDEAESKYQQAAELNPQKQEIWNSWGGLLAFRGQISDQEHKASMLACAAIKCRRAEALLTGAGAYNLACICAQQGNLNDALAWLECAYRAGKLPSSSFIRNDPDLATILNTPDGVQFLMRIERKEFTDTI